MFAPTNDAFAELPDGALDELLKDKDKLRAVLTYHVVPGNIMSTDIKGKTTDVETVEGSTIAVDATNGVMINDAMVIKADIKAKNGVIHVIDKVLLPPSPTTTKAPHGEAETDSASEVTYWHSFGAAAFALLLCYKANLL